MDGVLVNSYLAHLESWQRAARQRGLDMTEEEFASTFGRTSKEIIEALWPRKFIAEQALAFDKAKEAAYRDVLREHFPAMDGAAELIQSLHDAGFKLAIGSSGPPENVELVRTTIRNGNLFDACVNGMEVTRGKPDPQVFLTAAKKLGIAPINCAVVEDAPVGLEAARSAGMAAIGLTGTAKKEALSPLADLVVDHLRELNPVAIADLIMRTHQHRKS